jgi:hypothetical protein
VLAMPPLVVYEPAPNSCFTVAIHPPRPSPRPRTSAPLATISRESRGLSAACLTIQRKHHLAPFESSVDRLAHHRVVPIPDANGAGTQLKGHPRCSRRCATRRWRPTLPAAR